MVDDSWHGMMLMTWMWGWVMANLLLGNFLLSRSVAHIRSSDYNPVMSGEKRLAMKSFYLTPCAFRTLAVALTACEWSLVTKAAPASMVIFVLVSIGSNRFSLGGKIHLKNQLSQSQA